MTLSGPPLCLTWEETRRRLINWSFCGSAAGGPIGKTARIVADYLRQGLCHFERENGNRTQAVHVHQLLSGLRRQLSELLPPEDVPPWFTPEDARPTAKDDEPDAAPQIGIKDLGLHILKKLVLMGDCGHLGSGFYVATPLRVVSLPSGGVLVLGSLPTADITPVLGVTPGWAGLARALPADPAARCAPIFPALPSTIGPKFPPSRWRRGPHASSTMRAKRPVSPWRLWKPPSKSTHHIVTGITDRGPLDLGVPVATAAGDSCRLAGPLPHPHPALSLLACTPRQRRPRRALSPRVAGPP